MGEILSSHAVVVNRLLETCQMEVSTVSPSCCGILACLFVFTTAVSSVLPVHSRVYQFLDFLSRYNQHEHIKISSGLWTSVSGAQANRFGKLHQTLPFKAVEEYLVPLFVDGCGTMRRLGFPPTFRRDVTLVCVSRNVKSYHWSM